MSLPLAVLGAFVGFMLGQWIGGVDLGKLLGTSFAIAGAIAGHFMNDSFKKTTPRA